MPTPLVPLVVAALALPAMCCAQTPHLVVGSLNTLPTGTGPASIEALGSSGSGGYATLLPDNSVAFVARVTGSGPSRMGYWLSDGSGFHALAVSSEPATGVPAASYSPDGFTSPPRSGPDGLVTYRCGLVGAGFPPSAAGIWSVNPGPPTCLAATGQPVTPIPGALHYSFATPSPTPGNLVNVLGGLTGSGVTNDNDLALFQMGGAGTRLIAREGDVAPGTPQGVVFDSFVAPGNADGAGRVAFTAALRGPGLGPSNNQSAWRETADGLDLVYLQGVTEAPGYADGTRFSAAAPRFALSGTVGLTANILTGPTITSQNDTGVWFWNGGYQQVLREGLPINPGQPNSRSAGQVNIGFDSSLTSSGTMLISSNTVDQANVSRLSLLRGSSAGFSVLLDVGGPAPGLSPGISIQGFSGASMNEHGVVALSATLTGAGVTPANDLVLYTVDPSGAFQLVLREGQLFEVTPGFFAHVTQLPGSFGFMDQAVLNDSDGLLFAARFDNGFTGLYTITVPAPGALAALAGAIVLGGCRRRPGRTGSMDSRRRIDSGNSRSRAH
jgi:hypothetical protein